MSGSNPFRRSSIHAQGLDTITGQIQDTITNAHQQTLTLVQEATYRLPVSTKHVRIASPPAIPISPETPISYPLSPIATTDAFDSHSPFHSRPTVFDSNDSNLVHTQAGDPASERDSRSRVPETASAGPLQMNVDAFKRLLMTGKSNSSQESPPPSSKSSAVLVTVSDSSSTNTTDTSSISRHSIFEPPTTIQIDTPRTSQELDINDVDYERQKLARGEALESRQRPPVPKTRHGKLITSNLTDTVHDLKANVEAYAAKPGLSARAKSNTMSDSSKALPPLRSDLHFFRRSTENSSSTFLKRPSTPPLERPSQVEASQPDLSRSISSKHFSTNDSFMMYPSSSSSISLPRKGPPAPPSRLPNRNSEIGNVAPDYSPVREEPSSTSQSNLDFSQSKPTNNFSVKPPPPPIRTPSSAKRASHVSMKTTHAIPPPPPPPRRARGSSRSSFDSQRPSMGLGTGESIRTSVDSCRPSDSSRKVSGASNADDILADLATLQEEVDALRSQQGASRHSGV